MGQAMLDDAIELVARQTAFLLRQEAEAVFVQLRPYLEALQSDPRVSAVLTEFASDAAVALERFQRSDTETIAQLLEIRRELTKIAPDLDDALRPEPEEPPIERELRHFDEFAEKPLGIAFPFSAGAVEDSSTTRHLLEILDHKLPREPRFRELRTSLVEVGAAHAHAFQEFLLAGRTLPGVALIRLLRFAMSVNPQPTPVDDRLDPIQHLWAIMQRQGGLDLQLVRKAIFSPGDFYSSHDERELEQLVIRAKEAAERLSEDLQRNLLRTRSHRTLIHRFKLRTESYDRDRLREMTEGTSNPENRLANELARYLFDVGLTPMLSPKVGGLRPDFLDRGAGWTFYVEVKQYKDHDGALDAARDGARQVWDTASVLKSFGLREAFLVIFRRSGPYLEVPEEIRADGIVIYPVVVAIADAAESGAGQKKSPVRIDESKMRPQAAKSE